MHRFDWKIAAFALSFTIAPADAHAQGTYFEFQDAGDPNQPASTFAAGNAFNSGLTEIQGTIGGADIVDSYCIVVDDPASFYATTNPNDDALASAAFDTRLFLFTAFTDPISGNDDSPSGGTGAYLSSPANFSGTLVDNPGTPSAGLSYILAITAFPLEALDNANVPIIDLDPSTNALVGPNPASSSYFKWDPAALNAAGAYTIRLAGASFCGPNHMFLTSTIGTADLSSWPDTFGQTGLDAADTICRGSALAANLPYPGDFVAWISDSQDDAYCRLFGLTGKRSTNCGQATLPGAIGPFVTTGGQLFAQSIEDLVAGRIYNPIRSYEFSNIVTDATFFSATDETGALHSSDTCADWTSAASSDTPRGGTSEATTHSWTQTRTVFCPNSKHLLCLRTRNSPRPTPTQPGRLAFVTSQLGNGDLSTWPQAGVHTSIAAGDSICQSLASAAGLANSQSFKAWLSNSSVAARDRLNNDGAWYRLDGALLASSKADLTSGRLETSLSVDENRNYINNFHNTWTGTAAAGTAASQICDSWTSSDPGIRGIRGSAFFADGDWTEETNPPCNSAGLRLYCFSDARATLFADGFESGDVSAWDGAVACAGC